MDGCCLLEIRLVGHIGHKMLRIQILSRRHVDIEVGHIDVLVVVVDLNLLLGVGMWLRHLLGLRSEEGALGLGLGLEKILSRSPSGAISAVVQETVEILEGLLGNARGLSRAIAAASD